VFFFARRLAMRRLAAKFRTNQIQTGGWKLNHRKVK